MKPRFEVPLLVAALMLMVLAACKTAPREAEAAAPAAQWQRVADSATQVAYLDPASLQRTDEGLRAIVKINYTTPQTFSGDQYRSARSVYIIDCAGNRVADRENAIYTETDLGGKRVQRASRSTGNLIWRDASSGSIDGELVTSACRRAP
jgi:hypothetical protein